MDSSFTMNIYTFLLINNYYTKHAGPGSCLKAISLIIL